MRSLALNGYGLHNDKLWQCFASDSPFYNEDHYNAWKWIESRIISEDRNNTSQLAKNIAITDADELFSSHDPQRLYGVRAVLMQTFISQSRIASTSEVVVSNDYNTPYKNLSNNIIKKYYKSCDRKRALMHCGWDSNFESEFQNANFVQQLETNGQFTRAAAVLIFGGGKIKKAINTLKTGAEVRKENSFNAIALALSGYTKDRNSFWREMCQSIQIQLSDHYLRAIFTFLTTDSETYSEILVSDLTDTTTIDT
ncbi:unnamed protein product, partial [Medioppia subpectinata]